MASLVNHPAPITVNLNEPAVDLNADLDDRDIELVQQTFARVAMLGPNVVGRVVFMNIFKAAPEAKMMFPGGREGNMWGPGSKMESHVIKVVETLAAAISMLKDLPALVPVLQGLGLRHVGYGVQPAHYDVVGGAIIASLATALGDKFTEPVKNAYLKVWGIVAKTCQGDHYKK
eukprot:TRINITY_DN91856_c0_g1_i1.p1 TRINITY_DN91856_c0_g1~~TRINITY_DN91856_c0_g1_i1.p1  ORF type:complete len:174 (+),score=36.63 TRINITY_DN91856_c0_g1_i1:94-615(+)